MSRPQYQRIADTLRARIAAGDLRAGERLPAVRALAAELGVGRHTVDAAYAELVAEGLVETRVGQGTFVAAPVPRSPDTPRSTLSRSHAPRSTPWVSGHREPIVTRGTLS